MVAATSVAVRRLFKKLLSLFQAVSFYLRLNPLLRFASGSISRNGRSSVITVSETRDFREFIEEEEETRVCLKFKFPTYEEFTKSGRPLDTTSVHDDHVKSLITAVAAAAALMDHENDDDDEQDRDAFSVKQSAKNASNMCEKDPGEKATGFYGRESEVMRAPPSYTEDEDVKSPSQETTDSDSDSSLQTEDFVGIEEEDDEEMKSETESSESESSDSKREFENPQEFHEIRASDKDEEDDDEEEELESLWEHQELIEQLKLEIKKVRATGLPTILEESESPKMFDDLRPWKIDEFQRRDCVGELHKLYKSYRERMRKFDIMNYQKMYAMGFLQLKDDPPGANLKHKPSSSSPPRKLCFFRHKVRGNDPAKKFMEELQGELEMVYVGQMCLSWEFLHWQYEKVWDLWHSDNRGARTFNEVASEFQQFQVLLQRFVEDEAFQGPRVQNYVNSRCVFRNLLQVPVIRHDSKSKMNKGMDDYAITSDMLVEIVEESIRIFWRFVRADKDCSVATINTCKKAVMETKKILQMKEKKLKSIMRSENCILKKLTQCRDGNDCNQVQCFFSQVDMSLLARVLHMSNVTTDQIIWCHNKLNRIRFSNGGIHVEPSFLLFPC